MHAGERSGGFVREPHFGVGSTPFIGEKMRGVGGAVDAPRKGDGGGGDRWYFEIGDGVGFVRCCRARHRRVRMRDRCGWQSSVVNGGGGGWSLSESGKCSGKKSCSGTGEEMPAGIRSHVLDTKVTVSFCQATEKTFCRCIPLVILFIQQPNASHVATNRRGSGGVGMFMEFLL